MKYQITYECRVDGRVFQDDFEFQSVENKVPNTFDPNVIEIAMKYSAKFHRQDMAGLKILKITPMESK